MKLQFLGTAAAEGIPAIFCTCETCRIARAKGGKNIRTRSQALVDDSLLIDFPADTFYHSMRQGLDLTNIHHIIITHVHADHLYPSELHNYRKGFANLPEQWPQYHFWGGREMAEKLAPIAQQEKMLNRLAVHELSPFTPTPIGSHTITALPAVHGTETPYIYMIQREDKTLLYAHDTGAFQEELWEYFAKINPRFDMISFDCTMGNRTLAKRSSHLSFADAKALKAKLLSLGYAHEDTLFVVNHFSHNSPDVNYEDRAVYEAEGFVMSYDGLSVEF